MGFKNLYYAVTLSFYKFYYINNICNRFVHKDLDLTELTLVSYHSEIYMYTFHLMLIS